MKFNTLIDDPTGLEKTLLLAGVALRSLEKNNGCKVENAWVTLEYANRRQKEEVGILEWIYNIRPEEDPAEDYVPWEGPWIHHFAKSIRKEWGSSVVDLICRQRGIEEVVTELLEWRFPSNKGQVITVTPGCQQSNCYKNHWGWRESQVGLTLRELWNWFSRGRIDRCQKGCYLISIIKK